MTFDRKRIYYKRNRLRQLRAFCYAARLRSITRAAARLGLTQPAVSLQVRELEYELEAVLFDRSAARISLTSAGESLYGIAEPLVVGMDGLMDNFGELVGDEMSGRLELAASMAGAATVLPPYIKRLREQYPEIRLRVRSCPMGDGMKLLRGGQVELVLGAHIRVATRVLEYREIVAYDIVLITALDHPLTGRRRVTPQEVAAWPAIVPPVETESMRFGESVARQLGVDVNAAIEVGGWEVIKRYVETGLGISVVPSICVHETDRLAVIPLQEYFETRSYGVYTRRGQALTQPARRLLQLLTGDGAKPAGERRRARAGWTS